MRGGEEAIRDYYISRSSMRHTCPLHSLRFDITVHSSLYTST